MLTVEEMMSDCMATTPPKKRRKKLAAGVHSQTVQSNGNGHNGYVEARAKYSYALVNDPAAHVPDDLILPAWSNFMWEVWDRLNSEYPKEQLFALLLSGAAGTTKTTLAFHYAAKHNRPLLAVNCQPDMTPEALLGCQQIRDGTSYWQPGLLQVAAECDAIVLFDEFNLMPSGVQAALNPITDGVQKGIFNPHTCHRVDWLSPRIIFAVNVGYAGTRTIQEAFKDRCHTLIAQYLKPEQEIKLLCTRTNVPKTEADTAVKVATAIRAAAQEGRVEFDLSPRALIRHCQMVVLGCDRHTAWTEAVMHRIGWSITTEASWVAAAEISRSVGDYHVLRPGER